MMSLINTNNDYLRTMRISATSPLVGVIVSIYYIGCALGAVLFSALADRRGRRIALFASLAASSLGNLLMFMAGLGYGSANGAALAVMLAGRVVMGIGVGGIDAVVPVYSAELSEDEARGKALAQEFQMNILGLNVAFGINLGVTFALGKDNQWAWRTPIITMQVFPVVLMALIGTLPESPRWLVFHGHNDAAEKALHAVYAGDDELVSPRLRELKDANDDDAGKSASYADMLLPGREQFHPTVITVMGQINHALTGYGALSVYGPQIFELMRFGVQTAELLTMANYLSYLALMTFAWLLIDAVGRRGLMLWNSIALTSSFAVLAVCAGLATEADSLGIDATPPAGVGCAALFVATGAFGIGWLATVWLIPTEIYPTTHRANGAAVSVVVWGLSNFAVTLLTPLLFNGLEYWTFVIFAATNLFAGGWTSVYLPETGGRSFEENQRFFKDAASEGSWRVAKVDDGEFLSMPLPKRDDGETEPLLRRVRRQVE